MHMQIAGVLTGRRTKWVALGLWIAVLVVAAPLSQKLTDVQNNEAGEWLPESAESTKALEAQAEFQSTDTVMTVILYEREGGLARADFAKAEADAGQFAQLEGVDADVQGPFPSEAKPPEALQTIIPLDLGSDGWEQAPDIVEEMRDIAEAGSNGLTAYVTGPGGTAADSAEAFSGIDTTLLFATIAVVVILLLLTYRSPVLWILPLFSAVVALLSSQGVIYLLAKHAGLTVNAQSAGILTVLVLGASTDYALLLVARYREELRRHGDRHEAMAFALHRAGPAIFASAGTVIVGMLCLLLAVMNSTQGLGPVAAIGVAVGLLSMLTLLPALLVIFGRWVFWPRVPHNGSKEPTETGIWAKVGSGIGRRPRAVWVVTALILGVACLGMFKLDADGLSTEDQYTDTVPSVIGAEVLAEHFPSGTGTPVDIFADADTAEQVATLTADDPGIADVADPQVQGGTAMIQATLADAPDSEAAYDTIERLRGTLDEAEGADALVGGTTAITMDIQEASATDNTRIIPLVLLVVFLILALLLRAVVAPLILIGTVVLSFGAALGVSALVFEYIFGFEGADTALPLFVFVFLVALGIDYNIFLMTRVREEALQHGTRRGSLIGLSATGGVITSAGLVLAGTFAVLGSLPLVFLAEMGFAVAFGVLLDTIVVRSVLVTALNLDVGRYMWWPSRLGKKRDVDVEEPGADERVLVDSRSSRTSPSQ